MVDIQNLDNHAAFKYYSKINKLRTLLTEEFLIKYFSYQRIYKNGNYTFLLSQPDLAKHFFSNEVISNMWQFNIPFANIQNGFLLWNVAKSFNNIEQDKISDSFSTNFNLHHGIDIINKFDEHADFFTFASDKINIYKCPISYLIKFIFYFKQECKNILTETWQNKFIIRNIKIETQNNHTPIFKADLKLELENNYEFPLKRYYLGGKHDKIYLTSQELICLHELAQGNTAKQTARILKLSPRTIETYLSIVKDKLNCRKLNEVIKIVSSCNLIYGNT